MNNEIIGTLSLALARCLKYSTGEIILNGRNKDNYKSLEEYRKVFRVYPQDSYLLSGTLREVLDPEHSHADLKMNTLIKELSAAVPNGGGSNNKENQLSLDMEISANGSNLSAGQKQIITLLRVVLDKSASVLLLDEAVSNLDIGAARRVIKIIQSELLVKRECSVLLIAHSLQDLALCNVVLVMDKGNVIEQGTPTELLQPGTKFMQLVMDMGGDAQLQHLKSLIQQNQ